MAFRLPTHLIIRPGCLASLPRILDAEKSGTVLLVTDRGLGATPWPERVRAAIAGQGRTVHEFDGVEPNPRHTTINTLSRGARENGVELVVGLGGGSVLDAAKAVAMLIPNGGGCEEYEGRNLYRRRPVPFVAIPTTCGTGSEVTWVSVITRVDEKRKISVKGETMFPTHALVDAELLDTLPKNLMAWTGADALTHALEAITGTEANPASDALCEKAVALLFRYLERGVTRRSAADVEARDGIMRAATLAGVGFGNADVAAVHCLSETIGGLHDVPHGLANAILLRPVLRFHFPYIKERLAELYPHCVAPFLDAPPASKDPAEAFMAALDTLLTRIEIPSFATLDVPESDHTRIAQLSVANNSNGSNPQAMGVEQYLAILGSL